MYQYMYYINISVNDYLLIYMLAEVALLHIVNNKTKNDLWNFLIFICVFFLNYGRRWGGGVEMSTLRKMFVCVRYVRIM